MQACLPAIFPIPLTKPVDPSALKNWLYMLFKGKNVPGSTSISSLCHAVFSPLWLILSAGMPAFFTFSLASSITFSSSLMRATFSSILLRSLSVRSLPMGSIVSKYCLISSILLEVCHFLLEGGDDSRPKSWVPVEPCIRLHLRPDELPFAEPGRVIS